MLLSKWRVLRKASLASDSVHLSDVGATGMQFMCCLSIEITSWVYKVCDSRAGDCLESECCKVVEHCFGVPDGVRSLQDSRELLSQSLYRF
jgi:hypothetical protein